MQVKAQGLLNAAKYIEETYGQNALGGILRAASPGVRETYTSAIAINWHPLDELCELVDLAESRLGDGSGAIAKAIGAAGASANLNSMLNRAAFYVGKPSFFMSRIASLWSQFNDEGSMHLLEMTTQRATIEVRGIVQPRATFCHILTGWAEEVGRTLGATNVSARHVEFRARGQTRCVWDVNGKFG
jgi:hypothetical protein